MYIIIYMCIAHTLWILFPPAHMPFSNYGSINIPSAVPRLAPTRWLGPQFLTFWGPYLGGAVGFINGSNYDFVSSTCWDMTSTTMVKNNPLKIVELHPTWWFLFLFLPKPNKQLTENMTFTWWKLLLYILKACTVHIFFLVVLDMQSRCVEKWVWIYTCV